MTAPKKKPAEHFEDLLGAFQLPVPVKEFAFHPERMWRFDYVWEDRRVAVDIDGGGFYRNAHNDPNKVANDNEKRNTASVMGWTVLVFNGKQLSSEIKRYAVGEFMESVLIQESEATHD